MKRLLNAVLASLALLPALAQAFPRSVPDAQAVEMRGVTITPRSIDFSALPRASSVPYTGPVTDPHAEGVWEEAEQEVQRQKASPQGPDLRSLGAHLTLDTTPPGSVELSPLAPVIGTGFEGITQGPYIPSEPTVAGGPLNVFSAGNVSVTVTNKDGTGRVETNGASFFGVTAGEGAISDAQCYYDALRGRFVAVAFTIGTTPSNYSNFYVVISKTSDARGAWWQYKFDMTKDGSLVTTNWSDYESIGITEDKLVLTGQQFTFSTNSYAYPKVRVIDRAALYAGSPVSYVDFVSFAPPPGGDLYDTFVTKCARNLTAGDATAHLLCVRVAGGTGVSYREVTGPPATPTLTAATVVPVAIYAVPPDAAQLGSPTLVPTNDCRPGDFVVRNGVLVIAWHFGATISATPVTAIRLLRLRTSDLTVLTDETFGAASTFYYYPSATVDAAGTVYLGFDRSSTAESPSAYATGRRPSDTSIEPSTLLKAGMTATAQSRWGDYTGIDNDASLSGPGGTTAWYAGQWTKGTNTFGTWINKLSFPYGQAGGTVVEDCDGNAGTTGDRVAIASVTLSLWQGATNVASTTTDGTGAYNFGYLEAGTYDVIVTPPAGGSAVDAAAGSGGTSQTPIGANDIRVVVTTAQASTGNQFVVTSPHALPAATNLTPVFKVVGDPGFTLTVNGSGFMQCSTVRVDGADRPTTYVGPGQLTAAIPAGDLAVPGARAITVFTTVPGGGSSAPLYLTVSATPDTQAPVTTVTSPTGGESWPVGTAHNITWTATDNIVVANVDLALSTDGGATFPVAIANGIANSGTYSWTVPYTPSATARVRVTAHDGINNIGADSSHANFQIAGWTVTASAGANGTITPSGSVVVADGATPAFTIAPAAGYHVLDVLVNGVSVGAVTNYAFPAVHADQTISASFAINVYTLNITILGSGTVALSPDQPTYDAGTLVTLTATPSAGFTFGGWSGDTSASVTPLTLVMNSNRNLTATFGVHTYVWNKTAAANWLTPANWTPNRTTSATDDVLIFNGGGSAVVTNPPTQTFGQLLIGNNTNVILQAGATNTLTIAGAAGTDLDIAQGSTLTVNGNAALTIALAAGATGSVSGSVVSTTSANRLTVVGAGALVFNSGSVMTLGTGSSGSFFGTGTGTSGLNSVIFQAGSLLAQTAGATPFGATAPNAVVQFQPGSRYRIDGAVTPAMAGRTYADFEYNNTGVQSPTGASAFVMDSLIVSAGTFNLNNEGGGTIRGSVRVKSGTTLGINPATGTPTFSFAGSAPQQVAAFGTFTNTANTAFAVNNASGVSLAANWPLAGTLQFTNGRLTTGANSVLMTASGSVTGASQGTGWVEGNLRRNFAAGSSSRTFDVGDAATYAPVALSVTGAIAAFDLSAATQPGDHPSLASSDIDPARSVNRQWTVTPSGSPAFAGADATFGFAAGDLDAGANPIYFVVRRFSAGWTSPAVGTRTATSTQATGITAFGSFAVGEKYGYYIAASAGTGGAISPSGAVAVNSGAAQSFTFTADPGFRIADVLVDGASLGPIGAYLFTSVSANHTIDASFAADGQPLTVNVVGSGSVGRVPDQATYLIGSSVQLTATPASGWAFSAWSGDLSGTTNPQDLVMNGPKSVTATFTDASAPTATLTAPNGGESVTEGDIVPITWTATDNVAVTAIDLLLSRTGTSGTFDTLATGIPNSGTHDWTATFPGTADAWVKVVAHDAAGNTGSDVSNAAFRIIATTAVGDGQVTAFALSPVVPNPTHGGGRMTLSLPRAARVHVSLLDVQGREVLVLADGEYGAGQHSVAFGARTPVGAGLYFVRMRVDNGATFTRRLAVAR